MEFGTAWAERRGLNGVQLASLTEGFPGIYDGSELFLPMVPVGSSGPHRHPPHGA